MALSFATYASLKQKLIYPELADTLLTSSQTMAVWDMGTTDAPYAQVNRLLTYPTVGAVDCTSSITASDISAGAVQFSFDTFESTVPLCWDVAAGANANGTAEAGILKGMMRAVAEKMEDLLITGGTNFNGLDDLITAGQTFAIAGSAGALIDLSKAIRTVKTSGRKVFVCNGATHDIVEKVLQTNSVLSYQDLAGGLFNSIAYRGIPFVINENVANGVVYLATQGGEGVTALFNESPERKIGGVFDLLDLGYTLGSINKHYRIIFRATQVLQNPLALAKITGFVI